MELGLGRFGDRRLPKGRPFLLTGWLRTAAEMRITRFLRNRRVMIDKMEAQAGGTTITENPDLSSCLSDGQNFRLPSEPETCLAQGALCDSFSPDREGLKRMVRSLADWDYAPVLQR